MAEIAIQDDHKQQLARAQHVLEWLMGERARVQAEYARLQAEFAHILQAGRREQDALAAFLAQHYGVDPAKTWTIDVERGIVITPDPGGVDLVVSAAPVVD